ncbi:MAG TPA: PAS domain-containing protein [Anaerolineae bacterium]|nr:PAS domain-containing protein [Anaerolineae bacterium]HQH37072.1 PAS domain-containing protein [Anaerolineae bacterium]
MATQSRRRKKAPVSPAPSRQKRLTLGLFIDSLAMGYQNALFHGVDALARERDVNLLVFVGGALHPAGSPAIPDNVLYELWDENNVDGLILSSGAIGTGISLEEMQMFSERFRSLPQASIALPLEGVPSVLMDNYMGMRAVVQHLVEDHGYRRIAFFHKQEGHAENDARYNAYVDVLAEHGIAVDPHLVIPGVHYNTPETGMRLLFDERQLRPRIDVEALVAVDDRVALQILDILQARGIRVPDDVALVGFDDIEDSRYVTPALTTARQPLHTQGRRAAELVLAQLQAESEVARGAVALQTRLQADLIVRRSCGCLDTTVRRAQVEDRREGGMLADIALSLDAALTARREEILVDMMQVMTPPDVADSTRQQIAAHGSRLVDAFITTLKTLEAATPSETFLWTLDEILRQTVLEQRDVTAWQDGISVLRRHVLSCTCAITVLTRVENLFQQARVMIGGAAQQAQAFQRLQAGRRDQMLRQVGQTLSTAANLEELATAIVTELSRLDIPSSYLSLYVDPQAPAVGSKLMVAYDRVRGFEQKSAVHFSSRQLVPEGFLPPDRRYSMVVVPLYFQNIQLGRALFEVGPREGTLYDALRGQISSALKGVLLTEQMTARALQLQTSAEVARAASEMLDPEALMQRVVTLVRERFNLYYAGLFLVEADADNPELQWAVLRAGTGEAGAQMVAQGHRLPVGDTSMVGWCIAHREARVALDVGLEKVRRPHPLLPDTRSELALPLISRGQVIGALTIQSTLPAAFSREDIIVLQTLADQLANAIGNARLYEALELEQYLMDTLMDNTPDHIYFKDRESRFIRASRSQSKRFGLADPQEIIGKWDFDFFTEEHARPAYEDEQRIIRTGESIGEIEERETWPDRPDSWVVTTKMPLRDSEGNIIGTFGISRDITARKNAEMQLAAERNLLRVLIDNLPDYIYIKDRQSRFLINNVAHLHVLGAKTQEEVVGKTDFDIFPHELALRYYTDEQKLMEADEALIDREEPVVDQTTGINLWVSSTKVPLHDADGKVSGFVGLTRDITERRRTEAMLRRRNLQLQTVAEVARTAGGVMDLETLMQQAVDLLRAQLDLYYVGLFLVDVATTPAEFASARRQQWAVLRAGTGEAGAQMVARGHRLEVGGTSMIGQCVATGQARIALDVGAEAVRFDNPLLPDTRSELALPLISRGTTIGALTIQSTEASAFSTEDVVVLQALADQLANAITNIRLFEQTQNALRDLEMIQRQYVGEAWRGYRAAGLPSDYEVTRPGVSSLREAGGIATVLPEIQEVLTQQGAVVMPGRDAPANDHAALIAPITQRGEIIGALGIHDEDSGREWTEDEVALVEMVAERMGIVAETLRLLEETQRTAGREHLIRQITDQIRGAVTVDEAIQRALRQLGDALGAEMMARLEIGQKSVSDVPEK